MNGTKGFWERRHTGEFFRGEFTLYKKEGDQFIGGYYLCVKNYFDEGIILPVLSSIEFLKPQDFNRPLDHYEKGLVLHKRGDSLQAQVEFANAYMLSPENPDFIFMFAKSLMSKEIENGDYVKGLLTDLLKIKPDHKEARKLLKEIELKPPKGLKN
jgi:hypothetical protein